MSCLSVLRTEGQLLSTGGVSRRGSSQLEPGGQIVLIDGSWFRLGSRGRETGAGHGPRV